VSKDAAPSTLHAFPEKIFFAAGEVQRIMMAGKKRNESAYLSRRNLSSLSASRYRAAPAIPARETKI
jgi:hypothetical protein